MSVDPPPFSPPPDSTLGFHPVHAASGRQEEAAKDDLTDADFIPDDYFITDDDGESPEKKRRRRR
jgi:hypothetical protein